MCVHSCVRIGDSDGQRCGECVLLNNVFDMLVMLLFVRIRLLACLHSTPFLSLRDCSASFCCSLFVPSNSLPSYCQKLYIFTHSIHTISCSTPPFTYAHQVNDVLEAYANAIVDRLSAAAAAAANAKKQEDCQAGDFSVQQEESAGLDGLLADDSAVVAADDEGILGGEEQRGPEPHIEEVGRD